MADFSLDFDTAQVLPFMQERIPGLAPGGDVRCIGLRRCGTLVAGVAYEGFNGHNMWVHLAGGEGGHWLNRQFLRAGFAYPFTVCGVSRLSGYVNASNLAARRFDEHVGFTLETSLRGAAPDGGDVLIYVMRKEDCRYV